jgi:hypothetical protein
MGHVRVPSQRQRLAIAAIYLAALTALGIWAHEGWPPLSGAGAWFYTAGIALLLSALVTEPFYTTPAAALANSAALVLLGLLADLSGLEADKDVVSRGRWLLVGLGIAILLVSALAIATHRRFAASRTNRVARAVSTTFGAGYFLFGVVYVFSAYGAFAKSPSRLALIYLGLIVFMMRPLERAVTRFPSGTARRGAAIQGLSVKEPGLLEVLADRGSLTPGDQVRSGQSTGLVITATESEDPQRVIVAFDAASVPAITDRLERAEQQDDGDPPVGYVADRTSVNEVHFRASSSVSETPIAEGQLVRVPIREGDVLFQITGASIDEERQGQASRSSYRVTAQKLGVWNENERRFDLIPWLPKPGAVAALQRREEAAFDAEAVGFVPGSRYGIRYAPGKAVTHNTAILGVLGSGKTTLAQELIALNIDANLKVLILDITRQHARHFDDLIPSREMDERHERFENRLNPLQANDRRDADGFFGSEGEFRRALAEDLHHFVEGCDPLRIYNPLTFTATTMSGFASHGRAEDFRELSTVEKTSLITETLLSAVATLGESDDARVCLVIEEGHSLVPEPAEGIANEERRAVALSARSVLQGRKYGLGCLLITQRTANVTKTILNQCHTVFALRSFDATGMAFLANYFGESYSRLISSLARYHAVSFGDGVNCLAPIIVRLNDPGAFRDGYWLPRLPELLQTRDDCLAEQQGADQGPPEPEDPHDPDDIPF